MGLGAASLAAGVVSMLAQNAYLASIANNEISAASLAPGYPLVIGIFALVGAGALLLDGWALRPRATECARLILRIAAAILATRRRLCNTHCVLQSAYDRRILARRNH